MLALLVATLLAGTGEPPNPLFKELLDKGVAVPGGPTLRLPAPMMTEALSAADQQAALKKAAGNLPFDLFVKKTDAAPFSLKIQSVEDAAGQRVAQTIDLAFIGYGDLDRAIKEDVLSQLIRTDAKKGKDADVKLLSEKQLRERGIELLKGANVEERYARLGIFLLEKVEITGVTRNVATHGLGWAVLAMRLDPRFAGDKQYPNRWRSYNALEEKFGPPQAYSVLAGYARVTKVVEPPGALFFELHVALHEPPAWFGGPNLLRSKLPLVLQENIRDLRRKLGAK